MSAGRFPWWYPRRSHEAWTRVRKKGAWHFVIVRGLLVYGGLMFAFTGLLSPLARHSARMLSAQQVATNAVIWAVAGLAWGVLTWHLCERNFLKHAPLTGTPKT